MPKIHPKIKKIPTEYTKGKMPVSVLSVVPWIQLRAGQN
jgi:hypothetical protein